MSAETVSTQTHTRGRQAYAGSVRVNLLPQATRERARGAQQRAVAGGMAALLVAGLGGAYWWATDQVSQAEAELADAEVQTEMLRAETQELAAFKELAGERDTAIEAITFALSDEVSLAGILQDFAAVVPPDTEFTTLNVNLGRTEEGATNTGSFSLTGRTLASHAPGVERTILQLEKISSFAGLYLNASSLDDVEDQVATFSLDGDVGARGATDRYTDGLPEELR